MKNFCFLYYGELGWEYLRWAGMARRVAKLNPENRYYVCTHEGRDILYEDFCAGSIHHDWWFYLRREFEEGFDLGPLHGYGSMKFTNREFDRLEAWTKRVLRSSFGIDCVDVFRPPIGIRRDYEYVLQHMKRLEPDPNVVRLWKSLKRDHLEGLDSIVAVFPRSRGDVRDWGESNYSFLVDALMLAGYGVVIGGHKDSSFCSNIKTSYGVVNLTEYPVSYTLGLVIAALEDCCGAIGGQSALPVIALGQGIPVLMFGCEKLRHSEYYNWTGAHCRFIEDQTYTIDPLRVLNEFEDFLVNEYNGERSQCTDMPNWTMLEDGETLPKEKEKC